ncbi:thioesterase [Streptomyces griseoviridis]|uniref:Thioesterase n=1 Tax=Streptomyces griseoviridis TaxID=45398 RepID=A0A3Q9KZF0_STRGD|nr:thioesterase domain-containing protein [Streptomyces griseoviridis]AZS89607.1 thioesterase [Streptomyces griseoviridis]QCN83555.1 putative thioesterase [Streptomyces griseoviridis]
MAPSPTSWLLGPAEGAAEQRLFCFPHAGSGASAFAAWRTHLPQGIGLYAVQLPARENRLGDPMPDSVEELARQAARALGPLLGPSYTLFGHSFGGLLAYALASELRALGHPLPRALLISSTRPPHLPDDALHTLPDAELLGRLREAGGVPEPLLHHKEFVSRLLVTLRTDLRLAAEYRPAPDPLPCPVRIFGAREDRVVPPDCLDGWREYADGDFGVHVGVGDLFTAITSSVPPHPRPPGPRAGSSAGAPSSQGDLRP